MTAVATTVRAGSSAGAWTRTAWLSFRREERRARRRFATAWVFPVAPPLLTLALFGDLIGDIVLLPAFPEPSYFDWMAAGAVIFPAMTGAGFTAVGLAEDIRGGFGDRLRLLGATPSAVTAGRLGFDAARTVPASAVILAVAVALAKDVSPSAVGVLGLLVLAAGWAMAWNGVFHLTARLSGNPHAPLALLPLFAPATFLSTVWLPAEMMPEWAARVAEVNPVSAVTEAAREWTTGGGDGVVLAGGALAVLGWGAAILVLLARAERSER